MNLLKHAQEGMPAAAYQFGDFRLDRAGRCLTRLDGTPVPLRPRAFETLLYLVEHPDTVLDKERLMEAVWPDSIVEENNLTQHISALRRVFGETPASRGFIVTVPGRGYRFAAEVTTPETHRTVVREPEKPAPLTTVDTVPSNKKRVAFFATASAILLLALAVFWWRGMARRSNPSAPEISAAQKSIAVLPFENLNSDPESAYFAAGIQDDVLTSLAQIHDLKVISRTSVSGYAKTSSRNMREIGRALGVANLLEGSVRREGPRVLVNVQLIDARNDSHLWAERYDRTVADSIGLQGELATQIASALKARLAPDEKARLGVEPTGNSAAYVLYLTALGKEREEDEIAAEQLYVQATVLDPKFALAYARASVLNSRIASSEGPRERKAKARAQAEEALRLFPNLGEGHMALGLCLYWGDKNYDAALKEFEIAEATSPNNAETYSYLAGIYRRQGRWRKSLATFQHAQDLDPRNSVVLFQAANSRLYVRDWPGARAGYNRVLEINPQSAVSKLGLAYLEVVQNNNPAAGRNILQSIPPAIDPNAEPTTGRWDLAMLERNYDSAEKILVHSGVEKLSDGPVAYYQGRTAFARGDVDLAQRYFAAAAAAFEGSVRDDPADPEHHADLGLLYAYLQRTEDALREARRAVELEPESQNAFHGTAWAANLALVHALVGDQDQAITLLERLLSTPGPVQWLGFTRNITLAELRLRWEWDSLRSNPRFQKILAGPEPQTILRAGH